MPKGSDTLIPIENVEVDGDYIVIKERVPLSGFSVREIGRNFGSKGENGLISPKEGTRELKLLPFWGVFWGVLKMGNPPPRKTKNPPKRFFFPGGANPPNGGTPPKFPQKKPISQRAGENWGGALWGGGGNLFPKGVWGNFRGGG